MPLDLGSPMMGRPERSYHFCGVASCVAVERILSSLLPAEARRRKASIRSLSMKNSWPVATWVPFIVDG